jgi:hypothetical protein
MSCELQYFIWMCFPARRVLGRTLIRIPSHKELIDIFFTWKHWTTEQEHAWTNSGSGMHSRIAVSCTG